MAGVNLPFNWRPNRVAPAARNRLVESIFVQCSLPTLRIKLVSSIYSLSFSLSLSFSSLGWSGKWRKSGACSCKLFRNTMLQGCLFDQEIVPFCFVPLVSLEWMMGFGATVPGVVV